MRYTVGIGLVLMLAVGAMADTFPTVQISIGVRDNGTTAAIGGNGGGSGAIEWINLDGQTLVLDGTWQLFTFNFATDPITGFTGNGVLDNATGTLEHIRIKSNGYDLPMTFWIDEVADTVTESVPPPPHPVTYTFGSFEEYPVGTEVMFRYPNFSGSTDAMIINDPLAVSLVADDFAYAGIHSERVYFQFVDNALTNWCRLTTYNAPNLPNPAVRFDQGSVLSFWMRGVPEPSALLMLGLVAGLLRRR